MMYAMLRYVGQFFPGRFQKVATISKAKSGGGMGSNSITWQLHRVLPEQAGGGQPRGPAKETFSLHQQTSSFLAAAVPKANATLFAGKSQRAGKRTPANMRGTLPCLSNTAEVIA